MLCICQGCKKALRMLDLIEHGGCLKAIILEIKHMENKENQGEGEFKGIEESLGDKQNDAFESEDVVKKEKEGVYRYIDFRIISLFILGVLLGFFIKTQTTKTIVIGSNDPKLEKTRGDYIFSKLRNEEVVSDSIEDAEVEIDESQLDELEESTENVETEEVPEEQVKE